METNALSQLSLRMLEVDSKDPLRKDPINMVKLGMDLQELQKVVNEGKSQGEWLKFIDQFSEKIKDHFATEPYPFTNTKFLLKIL